METENTRRQGVITQDERDAIKNISGHNSATVNDFYLKIDRSADACRGREAFNKLMEAEGIPLLKQSFQTEWQFKDDLVHAPWGTQHPSFNKSTPKNMRVKWSPEELQYIYDWIMMNQNIVTVNKVAKCLHHIEKDERAYPIFHLNHVLTSARLRTGFDRALQMVNVQQV